ncbi:MAG: hypothetical protein WCJ49_08975, partial [Deltaproteobacteria bacterium]
AKVVAAFVKKNNGSIDMWVRTPIIPDATDSEKNIMAIGAFIANELDSVPVRWELCAFNNFCRDKYERLGMEWNYRDAKLITHERMETLASVARAPGVTPDIVHWSGPVRYES